MGVTINSVSTGRQAGAENLLLDSGAQLHACPITYPGQSIPLPDLGIQTASGARLQYDGGRLVTTKFQKDEQFECFSTRVQFRNQFCLLVGSLSRGTGVILFGTLSESAPVQDVRRIPRTCFTTSRTVENRRSCASTSVRQRVHG